MLQATNENLPPNVIKQLARELKNLDETPPEGIKVGVNDDDFSTIFADIDGPGTYWLIYMCVSVIQTIHTETFVPLYSWHSI